MFSAIPAQQHMPVVFVNTSYGTFTEQDKMLWETKLQNAAQWWRDRGAAIPALTFVPETVYIESAHMQPFGWEYSYLSDVQPKIFIVQGVYVSRAVYQDYITLSWKSVIGGWHDEAIAAHEFGHFFLNLPDLYTRTFIEECTIIDIMCNPYTAYPAQIAGCKTRYYAQLEPCHKIYLPVAVSP